MPDFASLFASGRIIDAVLLLMLLEGALLLGLRARTGRGVAPKTLLTNLAAGAALMLALRAALTGAPWTTTAAFLAAALAAHLADLFVRWD